jgi:hypothetical protein
MKSAGGVLWIERRSEAKAFRQCSEKLLRDRIERPHLQVEMLAPPRESRSLHFASLRSG